jgi:hypothetical protein
MSALSEVVAASGSTFASYVAPELGPDRFDKLVVDPGRRFVLEAVYEGYLVHYGTPRAFERMDADLRLLAGDALYALGLSRLAASSDLEAVAELADVISRSAQAHAEGRGEEAEAIWSTSARALASPPR